MVIFEVFCCLFLQKTTDGSLINYYLSSIICYILRLLKLINIEVPGFKPSSEPYDIKIWIFKFINLYLYTSRSLIIYYKLILYNVFFKFSAACFAKVDRWQLHQLLSIFYYIFRKLLHLLKLIKTESIINLFNHFCKNQSK